MSCPASGRSSAETKAPFYGTDQTDQFNLPIYKLQDDVIQIRNNILLYHSYFIHKVDKRIACPVNTTGGLIEGERNILKKDNVDIIKRKSTYLPFFLM